MQIGTLVSTGSPEVSLALEGRGLKGGGRTKITVSVSAMNQFLQQRGLPVLAFTGRFGQTTPPLVEFLKDILRRYPEGGQILKVNARLYLQCFFIDRRTFSIHQSCFYV